MSTENLSDRISFFKKLEGGTLSGLKNEKSQLNRSTSKIKIPTIFESVSSDNENKESRRPFPFGSASNLSKNKLPDRSEMTQSAFSLNHLGVETTEITKAKSQENILNDALVEECQLSQNPVTSSFDVLSKFKAVENLADTENLDTQVKENLEVDNEVPKPRILDFVYKKIEQNSEDKNIQFRQRLNELKIKRTNSLKSPPEEEKAEPKPPLFVKKLKEIKSKRRSTDLETPRTVVFNFIKKNDNLSKSFSNLSTLHQEAEIEDRKKDKPFHKSSDDLVKRRALILDDFENPIEKNTIQDKSEDQLTEVDSTNHKGLKIIPKEIRNHYLQELDTQYSEEIVADNLQKRSEPPAYNNDLDTPNLHLKQEAVYEAEEELYVNERVAQEDGSTLKVIPKAAPRSRNVSENIQSEETENVYVNDTPTDSEVLTTFEQGYDELTGRKSFSTSGIHDTFDPTPRIVLQLESPDVLYENQEIQSASKVIPRPAPRKAVEDEMVDNEEYANLPLNSPPISPRSENGFPKAAPRTKTPHTSESEIAPKDFIRQRSISCDDQSGENMYEHLLS